MATLEKRKKTEEKRNGKWCTLLYQPFGHMLRGQGTGVHEQHKYNPPSPPGPLPGPVPPATGAAEARGPGVRVSESGARHCDSGSGPGCRQDSTVTYQDCWQSASSGGLGTQAASSGVARRRAGRPGGPAGFGSVPSELSSKFRVYLKFNLSQCRAEVNLNTT